MSVFTEKKSGFKFTIDPTSLAAQNIIREGFSTHALIEWCGQYLSSKSTFVDVGAHIGAYSLMLSTRCRAVHSFEPATTTRGWLNEAINTNRMDNVQVHEVALGAEETTGSLYHVSPDGLRSSLNKGLGVIDVEEVPVKTLDSYALTDVSFIKINVNGTEVDVLKGSLDTLKNNQYPPVLVEAGGHTKDDLQTFLRQIGYQVYPVSGCQGVYLASDHPQRPKEEKKSPVVNDPVDFEDYLELARSQCKDQMYLQAYNSAHHALSLTQYPRHKMQVYKELAHAAFCVGEIDECIEVGNKVLLSFLADWDARNSMLRVLSRCMRPLSVKRRLRLEIPTMPGYSSSSTSIVPYGNGFRACVRTVNYVIDGNGGYIIHDPHNRVMTTNYIAELDSNLRPGTVIKLVDHSGISLYPKNILGLEDVRIFGNNQFFSVYLEVNEERLPQVCYGEYDNNGSITKILPLTATEKLQCEKNWLPFARGNEVFFIYNMGPFQLYQLNTETGAITMVTHEALCDANINDFRGSAPPIPYKEGWLAAIHQVYHNDKIRHYFHRLVWFDSDFTTVKVGELFYFQDISIEYTLSLCHSDEGLLIPYSYRDSSSVIAVVDYAEVDRMLQL